MFLAQVVNEVCAGPRPAIPTIMGIAPRRDAVEPWARFMPAAPQHSDKRWTVAFLLGCQVRAMMARRRSVAVAVAPERCQSLAAGRQHSQFGGDSCPLRRGHGHQSRFRSATYGATRGSDRCGCAKCAWSKSTGKSRRTTRWTAVNQPAVTHIITQDKLDEGASASDPGMNWSCSLRRWAAEHSI